MEEHFKETAVVLMITLTAAALLGLIFKRWRQPVVLAELIIGIILGPSLLGIIHPEKDQVVQFLAVLGLVVLMFEVGLETKLHGLFKIFIPAFLVAVIGVAMPLVFGFAVFFLMGGGLLGALFVGATLTATSTGITIRVLMDMERLDSKEAKIILGAAVIDDILGLILLSVLGQMAQNHGLEFFTIAKVVGLAILFVGSFLLIAATLANRIFNLVVRFARAETFLVAIFAFCLALAVFSIWIGLAAFVGAFMAGLMLEHTGRSQMVEREFKTLGFLFTPLFFVSAGAMFDISVLGKFGLYPLVIMLLVVAILGKILSGFGAVRQNAKKFLVGVGMIPRGEIGLIFASFGLSLGMVDKEIYSALLLVIMLTTFAGPLLFRFLLRKELKKGRPEVYPI